MSYSSFSLSFSLSQIYTVIELINQFINWSQQQEFHPLVTSLLISTLKQQDSVISPLSKIVAEAIHGTQVQYILILLLPLLFFFSSQIHQVG